MRTVIPKSAKLIPARAKRVFKGVIHEVYHWDQEMFDGSLHTYEMIKRFDTVKIIAVKDDKLILLSEEQPYVGKFYGVPAGKHDNEDETELEAAKRELLEETGMTFNKWKLLEVLQPSDITEQFIYHFLATDFDNQIETKFDPGEKIEIMPVSLQNFKKYFKHPRARYLPEELFENIDSLDQLINLPEYEGHKL